MPPTPIYSTPGGAGRSENALKTSWPSFWNSFSASSYESNKTIAFQAPKFEIFHQKALPNGIKIDVFRILFRSTLPKGKTSFGLRRLQRNVGRAVQKVVGNRTKNGSFCHALPAFTFSSKCARKGFSKGLVWAPLGSLLSLWRPTWSPKGAQSRHKGRPNEALESALATRGARMLPKGARDLENGAHVLPKGK